MLSVPGNVWACLLGQLMHDSTRRANFGNWDHTSLAAWGRPHPGHRAPAAPRQGPVQLSAGRGGRHTVFFLPPSGHYLAVTSWRGCVPRGTGSDRLLQAIGGEDVPPLHFAFSQRASLPSPPPPQGPGKASLGSGSGSGLSLSSFLLSF